MLGEHMGDTFGPKLATWDRLGGTLGAFVCHGGVRSDKNDPVLRSRWVDVKDRRQRLAP